MPKRHGTHGQATLEYVALVALVAIGFALASGLTAGGLGGTVLAGLQQGLCRVALVHCPRPARAPDELDPCPVERATSGESLEGAFEILTLGGGAALTAVRMSDGRVRVTLSDRETAGGELGLGGSVAFGRRHGTTGFRVEQRSATGRSWTLPHVGAARAFLERHGTKATLGGKAVDLARGACSIFCDALGWRPHATLPPADEVSIDRGSSGRIGASLGLAGAETFQGRMTGVRFLRDGGSTWYVQLDAGAGAALLSSARIGVGARHQTVIAYTLDARHRPVELAIESVAREAASAGLHVAGRRAGADADADVGLVTELEATLDLRSRRNLAVAVAFTTALRDPFEVVRLHRRAVAVGRRIASTGVVDRRTYALSSSAFAAGGKLMLGGSLGGGFERTREGMRLVSAATRLPGLPFLPRDDCRPA